MRYFIFTAFMGCATIHQPVGEDPPVVTYVGTAQGAALIIDAQNTRPYDLAESAMEKGMSPSLTRTDDFVGFSAGNSYGYGVYPGLGGYASADVVSTTDGWYAPTGFGSSLPRLGTTVVAGVHGNASDGIVPCPTGRRRSTVAEQAACTEIDAKIALTRTK
ncbi:MAG: hypothetical protein WC654_04715 [Patescibacteria group bacterium]